MKGIATLTATEIRDGIVAGSWSIEEVIEATLKRIGEIDSFVHSILTIDPDNIQKQVDDLNARHIAGEKPGPLWGVPFTIKDLYDAEGLPTTYGSRVFKNNVAKSDCEMVRRMKAAGAILVGKSNTPEFAIYVRSKNDLAPETRNPWDLTRTSGGSSGGAAASVAARLTPISIGSDGGGSIRIPGSLCGVVGLMPSRGAIPRAKKPAIGTRRFSSPGPMAWKASDALTVWDVIQGPDWSDGLSRGLMNTGVRFTETEEPIGIRWIQDCGLEILEQDVVDATRDAVERLAHLEGAYLHSKGEVLLSQKFHEHFYAMMQADRLSTGGNALLADPETNGQLTSYARHHFERASVVTGEEYSQGIEMQLAAVEHLESLLEGVDVIATPAVGFIAPVIPDDSAGEAFPEDARRGLVAFTYLVNFTGFAAVSVPCGIVRGMPVAFQLIGKPGSEARLLQLAARFQEYIFELPQPEMRYHV